MSKASNVITLKKTSYIRRLIIYGQKWGCNGNPRTSNTGGYKYKDDKISCFKSIFCKKITSPLTLCPPEPCVALTQDERRMDSGNSK